MPGQTVRPPNLHTNHLSAVVRSPFSSVTNPRRARCLTASGPAPAAEPHQPPGQPRRHGSSAPRPVLRQLKPGVDSARADFGLHKVGFAGNLAVNRSVGITTPDNQPLTFRPTWLACYDTASGRCVLLATIQDCSGAVQWPDRAIYPNAFSGSTRTRNMSAPPIHWSRTSFCGSARPRPKAMD